MPRLVAAYADNGAFLLQFVETAFDSGFRNAQQSGIPGIIQRTIPQNGLVQPLFYRVREDIYRVKGDVYRVILRLLIFLNLLAEVPNVFLQHEFTERLESSPQASRLIGDNFSAYHIRHFIRSFLALPSL